MYRCSFTQMTNTVRYSKPHAAITRSAESSFGNVAQVVQGREGADCVGAVLGHCEIGLHTHQGGEIGVHRDERSGVVGALLPGVADALLKAQALLLGRIGAASSLSGSFAGDEASSLEHRGHFNSRQQNSSSSPLIGGDICSVSF